MPSSIELNIGHVPSPRRTREPDDDGESAPFRIVVLGDFSGHAVAGRPPLGERRALRIDIDTFDAVFARLAPSVEIAGLQDRSGAASRIEFETLDDFGADALLARLAAHALSQQVGAPATTSPTASAPEASPSPGPAEAEDAAATLRRLLGGSVPSGAPARAAGVPAAVAARKDDAVDRFIRQLVAAPSTVPQPAAAPVAAGSNDAAAALLRHVLRDPAWRHLEAAWRSVDRFVRQLDMPDVRVRLELLDCRADEVLGDLSAAGGDATRSALTPALKGDGRGCALLVSLEEFGPGMPELSLLAGLATLAAAHGGVLLAGAAPALAAVASSEDDEVRATPEARVWRALRDSGFGPCVGLTFPRLLARLPYGPRNEPVAAFPFDELADPAGGSLHDRLLWRSAALDAALLLAQGHVDEGVESLVQLEDLPAFVDRSGDEPALQAVAEAYVGEREVGLLQAAGFIVLQSDRRMPRARVSGWQSIASGGTPLRGSWRAS